MAPPVEPRPKTIDEAKEEADAKALAALAREDVPDAVSRAYGVYKQKNLYGKKSLGIERTTFIIDRPKGTVKVWPQPDGGEKRSASQAVVIVSGGDATSPYTSKDEACATGLAAGNTDTALREFLLKLGEDV